MKQGGKKIIIEQRKTVGRCEGLTQVQTIDPTKYNNNVVEIYPMSVSIMLSAVILSVIFAEY